MTRNHNPPVPTGIHAMADADAPGSRDQVGSRWAVGGAAGRAATPRRREGVPQHGGELWRNVAKCGECVGLLWCWSRTETLGGVGGMTQLPPCVHRLIEQRNASTTFCAVLVPGEYLCLAVRRWCHGRSHHEGALMPSQMMVHICTICATWLNMAPDKYWTPETLLASNLHSVAAGCGVAERRSHQGRFMLVFWKDEKNGSLELSQIVQQISKYEWKTLKDSYKML